MVSFWLGRAERDAIEAIAAERKWSKADAYRALIEFALESPVERIYASREDRA